MTTPRQPLEGQRGCVVWRSEEIQYVLYVPQVSRISSVLSISLKKSIENVRVNLKS